MPDCIPDAYLFNANFLIKKIGISYWEKIQQLDFLILELLGFYKYSKIKYASRGDIEKQHIKNWAQDHA